MAKGIWLGSAEPDDPIYSSGLMVGGISSGRSSAPTPKKPEQELYSPVEPLIDLQNLPIDPVTLFRKAAEDYPKKKG